MLPDENYWNSRYTANDTTWDIGKISAPLKAYFDQLTNKNISILVPGCGNSYEAGYLSQQGFTHVTVLDISAVLCKKLEQKFSAERFAGLQITCADFFEHRGQYDLIVEQTFFCALHPSARKNYVQKMSELLSTRGKLAGLLFNRSFEDGPPFGGTETEYRSLFEPAFTIAIMAPCYNSIAPRMGAELFIKFIKK